MVILLILVDILVFIVFDFLVFFLYMGILFFNNKIYIMIGIMLYMNDL